MGAYTRWFNSWALLLGWAAGTLVGTWMAIEVKLVGTYTLHLGDQSFPGYIAVYSVILNLLIAVVLTPVFNAIAANKADQTVAADYQA
jgi:SSS family solute:Na+ symporter